MALPTVQMTSAGATTINTLPGGPAVSANGVATAFPTDQGPQPYTGTWTARSGNITNAGAQSAVVAVLGGALSHNYIPADTITLSDGAPSVHGVLTVTTTGVSAASIAAAGTYTGTTGTFTVTGTTGTGTKFTASCTLTNGSGITAVLSILTAGVYTVNPTTLTSEPVTATNLSTAALNIKMGVVAASVTTAGNVTAVPANPVAQASSSGVGTGATFTMTYIGISQTLMSSNASRKCFFVQNPQTALGQNITTPENLYINYTSASGVQDGVSIELGPGGSIPVGPVISTELITVNAQTLGHRYIAREM